MYFMKVMCMSHFGQGCVCIAVFENRFVEWGVVIRDVQCMVCYKPVFCLTLSCGLWHLKCRQRTVDHTLPIVEFELYIHAGSKYQRNVRLIQMSLSCFLGFRSFLPYFVSILQVSLQLSSNLSSRSYTNYKPNTKGMKKIVMWWMYTVGFANPLVW